MRKVLPWNQVQRLADIVYMKFRSHNQSGFIALTSVLLILAVASAAAIVVTYSSINEAQSGLALYKGEQNLAFVEGCTEDYLLKIRMNAGYTGGNVTRPDGTCTATIFPGGLSWSFTNTSLSTPYQRQITTAFTRYSFSIFNTPGIHMTTWGEY